MSLLGAGQAFLPPAKEVWGRVMFLHLCVILFTRGEGVWLPNMHYRSHGQGGLYQGGAASRGFSSGGSASGAFCIGAKGEGVGWADLPQDTWDATGYSQKVSGTHPTEMTSS